MNLKCFKDDCDKVFDSVAMYKYHLKYSHNLKTQDTYKCPISDCQNYFNRSDNFYHHLQKHDSNHLDKHPESNTISNTTEQIEQDSIFTTKTFNGNNVISEQETTTSTIQTTEYDYNEIFFNFLTDLHAEPSLSRTIIDKIFKSVRNDLLQPILASTDNKELIQGVEDAYSKINTHYKYKKRLKELGLLHSATKRTVSSKIGLKFSNGEPVYDLIKNDVSLMPIIQQIKAFFELPNLLRSVMEYMQMLEQDDNTTISNYIQCENWRKIKRNYNENDIVLPCFLYHDDFQPDNPLSGNTERTKIGAFYYSFPILPQYLLSSPKYIFEAMLLPSNLKNNHLELILQPLIEIFKELETKGLVLNIQGKEVRIYIVMSMIIGDNLGIHELLGMSKSFNAKYSCRFCLISKEEFIKSFKVDERKIRKAESYDDHLFSNEYGVKEYCYFNDLHSFHAYENYAVDIMHDIFEGIGRYDIAVILKYIIYEKKIIDLFTLNRLKQEFDYGQIEIGNRGNEVLDTQIKNDCLIMSASEMNTFLHFLPLIIGHKMTNQKHGKVWKLMCQLIKIVDLLMQSELSSENQKHLSNLISGYIKSRIETFPNVKIKPKHHLLLHYSKSIIKIGPPRHIMSFSYEQKNRLVKKYSKVCHQRVNLSWSLTYKCVTSFNQFLKTLKLGLPSLYLIADKKNEILTWDSLKSKKYFSNELFDDTWKQTALLSLSWLKYKSTLFREGYFVALNINTIKCFKIINMLKKNDIFYLVVEEYNIIEYSEHYLSYIVGDPLQLYKLVKPEELEYYPFNSHQTICIGKAFRLKKI